MEFNPPTPAVVVNGVEILPPVEGVWHDVCKDCLKPDDKIKPA
jgi:hypothetical protein